MNEKGVIEGLFSSIIETIDDVFISATSGELASELAMLGKAGIGLYIVIMGYMVMAGKIQRPMEDLMWNLGKMAIILGFLENGDGYLNMVSDVVFNLRDGLVQAITGNDSVNIYATLDNIFEATQKLSALLFVSDRSLTPVEGLFAAALAWAGGILSIFASSTVLIMAEISLRILLITAPIFIFCLMFGFLRPMFNNWLNLIFSNVLTIMFVSLFSHALLKFQIKMFNTILSSLGAGAQKVLDSDGAWNTVVEFANFIFNDNVNVIGSGAIALLVGLTMAGLIKSSSSIANQLAGASVEQAVAGIATAATTLGIGYGARLASAAITKGASEKVIQATNKGNNLTGVAARRVELIERAKRES